MAKTQHITAVEPLDEGTKAPSTQELLAIISAANTAIKAANDARNMLRATNANEISNIRYEAFKVRKQLDVLQAEYDTLLANHDDMTGVGKFRFTEAEEKDFTRRYEQETK